jgi:formylglycine-generating enzyme required for sulfatase activity
MRSRQVSLKVLIMTLATENAASNLRIIVNHAMLIRQIDRQFGNDNGVARLWLDMKGLTRRRWFQLISFASMGATAILIPILFRLESKQKLNPISKRKNKLPLPPTGLTLTEFEFEVVTVDTKGQKFKQEKAKAQYFTEDLGNGVLLEMVAIPRGKFLMGAPEGEGFNTERPQHEVNVSPFFIGQYTVTQAQWKAIACLPKINRTLSPKPSRFKGDSRPVEQISWYDAVEFCERLSKKTGRIYRLPSESEWEYACRAGTTTRYHFGEALTHHLANYHARVIGTTPIGSFPPNAFGLYDLHGNVWEWCADPWHKDYQAAPTNSSVWITNGNYNYSPLRGGSWFSGSYFCRSAYRNREDRTMQAPKFNGSFGFRVVCCALS